MATISEGTIICGTMQPHDLIPALHAELRRVAPQRAAAEPLLGWGMIEVESLIADLNEFAPDGFYFGAHPADGADFGWWKRD